MSCFAARWGLLLDRWLRVITAKNRRWLLLLSIGISDSDSFGGITHRFVIIFGCVTILRSGFIIIIESITGWWW